jgi:hypothetical protein
MNFHFPKVGIKLLRVVSCLDIRESLSTSMMTV